MTPTTSTALLSLLSLATLFSTAAAADDERNALILLRDSLASPANLHSNWTGPPCYNGRSRWFGISCSASSRVVALVLDNIQLTGELPAAAFQNVSLLVNLSLADNALRGELPGLNGLVNLRAVSFAKNRFAGPIPASFVELLELEKLELEDNLLNGSIPAFQQPTLSVFDVSYNSLQGPIPETSVLQRFPGSSYDHNSGLCGTPLHTPCPAAAPPPATPSGAPPSPPGASGVRSPELWILVSVAVGAVMVPFVVVLCFLCYHKRRRQENPAAKAKDSGEIEEKNLAAGGSVRIAELEFIDKEKPAFDLDDLLRASAEVMGKGKLGTTYQTTLESGDIVAVKRLREVSGLSRKEFVRQMQVLGRLKHENIVQILAFYSSKDEKLVIFEHVPNGSLFQLLHDNRGEGRVPLSWGARLSIVKGISRGMAHLHQALPSHKVPHANLKSPNVLILKDTHNRSFCPKLTDYGFLPFLQSQNISRKLAISKSPEFSHGRRVTYKTDVFCFGLILIEIITGMIPAEYEEDLSEWVRTVVTSDWSTDILDLEIVAEKEGHGEMLKLAEIALECTAFDPERRPKISELVQRIEEIKEHGER